MKRELQPWHPGPELPLRPYLPSGGPDRFFQAKLFRAQLHRYLHGLLHRWWVLVLSLVLIGGPALVYAWHKPLAFESRAMMCLTGRMIPPGEGVINAEDPMAYLGTQAQLIKSPPVVTRALAALRTNFPALSADPATEGILDCPFELSAQSSQRNSLLILKAVGPEPKATRVFLNALMDEYLAFKNESRRRTSTGALSAITAQVNDVEAQIKEQQNRLAAFEASNNVSFLTEHRLSAGSHLATISSTLADCKTKRELLDILTPEEYRGMLEAVPSTRAGGPLPDERFLPPPSPGGQTGSQVYQQAVEKLQIAKAKYEEFAPVLRPTHSKMVKLTQEIHGLEKLLNSLQTEGEARALAQMRELKKSLDLQIANLESQYRMWETNASAASQKLLEYDRMNKDAQRLQVLYDRLMSLIQTVDASVGFNPEPMEIVARAGAAQATTTRYQIAAAGLFLGLLVGLGVFLLMEFLDDRITSVTELSLQMPAEVIGQIPRTSLRLPRGDSHLLPLTTAQPGFAESFRNLRSSLLFMSGQEVPPKLVLITSAIPKEGKTTVASNLAGILAMSGARVLLVDADFRRGYIHRMFRVRRKPGLLEVLREEVSPSQAVVASGQPNLFVLPAGETGDYTSDVLLRHRVDRLLQTLAKGYDHVIVDSAPVLATDDAACLGPYMDGAFLVVRAAYTSSRMTQEAWGQLTRRNVRVLGVIYNCAPASTDYYSQYSREYHAGRSPEFLQATQAAGAGEDGEAGESR